MGANPGWMSDELPDPADPELVRALESWAKGRSPAAA
jgi:hypothetical protein